MECKNTHHVVHTIHFSMTQHSSKSEFYNVVHLQISFCKKTMGLFPVQWSGSRHGQLKKWAQTWWGWGGAAMVCLIYGIIHGPSCLRKEEYRLYISSAQLDLEPGLCSLTAIVHILFIIDNADSSTKSLKRAAWLDPDTSLTSLNHHKGVEDHPSGSLWGTGVLFYSKCSIDKKWSNEKDSLLSFIIASVNIQTPIDRQ